MRSIRVLCVANAYPSEKSPWAGVFIRDFNEGLEKLGVVVSLAVVRDVRRGVYVPMKYVALAAAALRRMLTGKYDIVHCHYVYPTGLIAVPVASVLRVPLVVTALGSDVMGDHDAFGMRMTRWILDNADAVNATSVPAADAILERFHQPASKVLVRGPGVDLGLFRSASDRVRARDGRGPFRLLFMGRLVDLKRWKETLQAVRLLKDRDREVRLLMIGSGDHGAARQYASALGVADLVDIVGVVPRREIPMHMGRCHAMVLASERESFGTAAVEGMAFGLPVIATRVGLLGEIIRHKENGVLLDNGDPETIADAVEMLMRDEALRAKISANAPAAASLHSVDKSAETMCELYGRLMRRKSQPVRGVGR
jgi:glycosyltransferase involved in cell wall biosynthesis